MDGPINRFHDKGEEEQNSAAGEQVVVHTWGTIWLSGHRDQKGEGAPTRFTRVCTDADVLPVKGFICLQERPTAGWSYQGHDIEYFEPDARKLAMFCVAGVSACLRTCKLAVILGYICSSQYGNALCEASSPTARSVSAGRLLWVLYTSYFVSHTK